MSRTTLSPFLAAAGTVLCLSDAARVLRGGYCQAQLEIGTFVDVTRV
jgi:hypothetical protein